VKKTNIKQIQCSTLKISQKNEILKELQKFEVFMHWVQRGREDARVTAWWLAGGGSTPRLWLA